MKTAPYSQDYFPSAPVLPIRLALSDEAPHPASFLALIDTGADGTFVPTVLLEEIVSSPLYVTTVRSHFGERSFRADVHMLDLIFFDTLRLPGMEVVGDDWGDRIIIGRNVLNRLRLLLDRPTQITQVLE